MVLAAVHSELKDSHVDAQRHSPGVLEFPPADTGLLDIDLKSIAASAGSIIKLGGARRITAILEYTIAGTTPTVGVVELRVEGFAADGTTLLLPSVLLGTLTSTEAAAVLQTAVSWGEGTPGKAGTIVLGTAADFDVLKLLPFARFTLDVTTAYDQDGDKTGSVFIHIGD